MVKQNGGDGMVGGDGGLWKMLTQGVGETAINLYTYGVKRFACPSPAS